MLEPELGEGLKCHGKGSGHLFWKLLSFIFIFLFFVWFEEKRQIPFGYLISVVVSFAFKIQMNQSV